MLIFLVGMMGSGKTTIGKLLAEELSLPFFDTDDIITSIEGSSVSEIFQNKGETHFRDIEFGLVNNWKMSHGVVSTGGGLPTHHGIMEILNDKGVTIYLKSSVDTLVSRVNNDPLRPLVANKTVGEVKKTLSNLLKERKEYYNKSIYTVTTNGNPQEIVKKIIVKIYSK